uniref:Structural maintenance of chromosomes protein n=1 Tax=Trichogramma kaykai TaxID=54128 RepID=A0ABD2X2J5_9HYME
MEGFKSYGERTIVEPFHPGHTVIIGKNGAGKSNFFAAIQFLLNNELFHLSDIQKQGFLFDSSNKKVITASVEIIFDNSDHSLPFDKDEVSLRRVIGLKKDQYFLNKKLITRNDLTHLIESPGLSGSNPYYIVQQGQINKVAMEPKSRLKLLYEIAGANVFESKKKDSTILLKAAQSKIDEIQECLLLIDEHIQELQVKMDDFKEFKILDRTCRTIEHVIFDHQLEQYKKKLKKMEEEEQVFSSENMKLNEKIEKVQKTLKDNNKDHKKIAKTINNMNEELRNLNADKEDLLKKEAQLELNIKDLKKEVGIKDEKKSSLEKHLKELNIDIQDKMNYLNSIEPKYEESLKHEKSILKELDLKDQQRTELYNKYGRAKQFKNKDERDTWISNEIERVNILLEKKREFIEVLKDEILLDEKTNEDLKNNIAIIESDMEKEKNSLNQNIENRYKLGDDIRKAHDDKKMWCKRESIIKNKLSDCNEELRSIDQKLKSMVGTNIMIGKNSIDKVLQTFKERPDMANKVNMYLGLVIEIFTCDPECYKAVEVVAGNRLFYHVVQKKSFGSELLMEMNRQKLPGEVTFIPLDGINPHIISLPTDATCRPLLDTLIWDNKYRTALQYIFGRILICDSLETCTKKILEKKYLDCVTLQGDQVGSQGWLKGGHLNNSKSTMKFQNERRKNLEKITSLQSNLQEVNHEIEKLDEYTTGLLSRLQQTKTKINIAEDNNVALENKLKLFKQQLRTNNENLISKKKTLQDNEINLDKLVATKINLQNELLEDFSEKMSSEDEDKLRELSASINELSQKYKKIFTECNALETEKIRLSNLLDNNLIRQRDMLVQELNQISIQKEEQMLKAKEKRLVDVKEKIDEIITDIVQQKNKIASTLEMYKSQSLLIENTIITENENLNKQKEENDRKLEKFMSKIKLVKENIETVLKKRDELGTIPSHELYQKYYHSKTENLFKILERTKNNLKNYSDINQKALEQFEEFTNRRDELKVRVEESLHEYSKIEELIFVLQQRKDEAIVLTFDQVGKNFSEIFNKLVPMGRAELVMKTSNLTHESVNSSVTDSEITERYVGIDVQVTFTGRADETTEMEHLSGGQKSLIALVLIFAIHKFRPAPFYLFDEIDQALDTEYRKAVAEMIHELSHNAQFITTTFRPELLQHANKFYEITYRNRISSIEVISKESAEQFIANDEME